MKDDYLVMLATKGRKGRSQLQTLDCSYFGHLVPCQPSTSTVGGGHEIMLSLQDGSIVMEDIIFWELSPN